MSLASVDAKALRRDLETASRWADAVELRLDLMPWLRLEHALRDLALPAIITVRASHEGGAFAGAEAARLAMLERALVAGAAAVDVEAGALASFNRSGPGLVIGSFHDFEGMPADFIDRAVAINDTDVVKAVATASSSREALAPLFYLQRARKPSIAIAMGEAGVASRVLALREPTCWLTYAAVVPGHAVAPGQVGLQDLHDTYRARTLGPDTKAIGLLGATSHDRIVQTANMWLAERELDAVAVPMAQPGDVDGALPEFAAAGFNVLTWPADANRPSHVRKRDGWRQIPRTGIEALAAGFDLLAG